MTQTPSSSQSPNKFNFNPNTLIRKPFTLQKLINFLIIIRSYLNQIPFWFFITIIVLLYLVKLRRQGNLPSSLLTIISIILMATGEYLKNGILVTLAPIFCGASYFLSNKIYYFPKVTQPIGFRQHVLQNDLYMMQLYPIKKNQKTKKKYIKWNHNLELNKMMQYSNLNNNLLKSIGKFFISAVQKYKINFAEGDQEKTNSVIVFSHGRTATPFLYSQIFIKLMSLQDKKFSIYSVQHTEKRVTGQTQMQKIKKFRQIQVQVRAAQMYTAILECKDKKDIILMGHSYGCATTVQAYHSLPDQLKKKVSCVILLDPWFFPLTQTRFKQEFKCPVLILANQFFLQNEDIYNRNNNFIEIHSKNRLTYMVWKDGDHLHQTDLGFVLGNTLGRIKKSQLSREMLNKNIQAIRLFIEDPNVKQTKMRQKFEGQILQKDFKPKKFINNLNF